MTEITEDNVNYIHTIPTELMYHLFSYFSAKELMKCRSVCKVWKLFIDGITSNDSFWPKACQTEFAKCYEIAKAKSGLSWFYLYRSLSKWPSLESATHDKNEFAIVTEDAEGILGVAVLSNRIVAVHTKSAIQYYNRDTLIFALRDSIKGTYIYYKENDNAIVLISLQCHLFVIKKSHSKKLQQKSFTNVRTCLLTDSKVFFVNITNEIYVCDISRKRITDEFLAKVEEKEGVTCVGYDNGCLNVLTHDRKLYTINQNKKFELKQSLDSEENIIDVLYRHNLLEELDWRLYFQWMYVLDRTLPEGPLSEIIIIKPYGDMFFVGTHSGHVFIFHKPFVNGKLDLTNSRPISLLYLVEITNFIMQCTPIIQIDILETETGHKVFVASPLKVTVFIYTHNFTQYTVLESFPRNELALE